MRRLATLALVVGLVATSDAASAQEAPPAADTFEREALTTLRASHAGKRGVIVHVGSQRIPGVVKAIGPDSVVLANQEHGRIVVRRERIDALEFD